MDAHGQTDTTTRKRARVADIIAIAADLASVSVDDIISPRRDKRIVLVRQAIVAVSRMQRPQPSFPSMGRRMNRDHSTLVHAFDNVVAYSHPERDLLIAQLTQAADEVAIFVADKAPHPPMREARDRPKPKPAPPMTQADKDEMKGNAFIDMIDDGNARFLKALRAA